MVWIEALAFGESRQLRLLPLTRGYRASRRPYPIRWKKAIFHGITIVRTISYSQTKTAFMKTECKPKQFEFHALGRREVVGCFDGGRITSDAGDLLLREVDSRIGLMQRLTDCFVNYRNPGSVEHRVQTLLAQRIYGVALGYEDLNDHDVLRSDSLLATLVGKIDVTGQKSIRDRDKGHPLASSSTLNRLELNEPDNAATSRYKRIAADPRALDESLVDLFIELYKKPPRERRLRSA
ncbi:MAG: transposase [Gammaproteobacteria bacterium]|nr:transposase [Gammaproteobacteria bacterium]